MSLTMFKPLESVLVYNPCVAHALHNWKKEGNARSDRNQNDLVWMCAKIFWHAIYCTNPRPKPYSQSGSLSCKGLGRKSPQIIRDYNLTTVIVIQPLTHTRTCKMCSSILDAMSQLKFASTTRASFTITPSTERKNGEKCFRWSWQCVLCLYFYYFTHQYMIVLLSTSFMSYSLVPPVWWQLWPHSDFHISPGWGCHFLSPIHPYTDKLTTLMWCGPGELEVFRVHSEERRVSIQCRGNIPAPHYYVRWKDLRVCS